MKKLDYMLNMWEQFFYRNNAKGDALFFFNKIRDQYNKPKRYYHTFEGHIYSCLSEFDNIKSFCNDSDLVYFELLNHDSYYDTTRNDNEEKSAEFAYNLAKEMCLPKRFLDNNGFIILPTKHNSTPDNLDVKFALDIDLFTFGKPPKEFDKYEENIKKEYSWVSEDIFPKFVVKRIELLQNFLKRAENHKLYLTDYFKSRYENQATINLNKSIKELKQIYLD